ncbi:MAG: 30S ribosomal protein S9 [Sulfolobales archaeon]
MSSQESPKIVISSGSRKTSIARAVIRKGNGRYRVNGIPIEVWPNEMTRLIMMEPVLLIGEKLRSLIDIDVSVSGGGYVSQAKAVRMAVARGILRYFEDESLIRSLYIEYDRSMLAGDPRQTEPEKWMRYSARRFRQKSYR